MRTRSLIERYGYYQDYIRQLSKHHVYMRPTTTELDLSRGAIQRAYKEMKQERFPGTIIDYIAWIGGMFELETLIKGGSIFDKERLVAYLNSHIESAAVLVQAVSHIRVVDLEQLYGRLKEAPELWEKIYRAMMTLKMVGLGVEIRAECSDEPELNPIINKILEYLTVKPDSTASSTSSQPTNQPTIPSEQDKKAARRGPRPKTPGHTPP